MYYLIFELRTLCFIFLSKNSANWNVNEMKMQNIFFAEFTLIHFWITSIYTIQLHIGHISNSNTIPNSKYCVKAEEGTHKIIINFAWINVVCVIFQTKCQAQVQFYLKFK